MNITPQLPNIPYSGVNPPSDSLRRDNSMREPIPPAVEVKPYPQEKPIGEADRHRNPSAGGEQNVQENRQQTEQARTTINEDGEQRGQQQGQDTQSGEGSGESGTSQGRTADGQPTPEQLQEEQLIKELILRDKEVRAHEQAHASAGGPYTGAPSYSLQQGPDGRSYAVGGEVSVDLSSIAGDPGATISKMQRVRAAALAPASPSVQDQKVAATAQRIIAQMQMQMMNSEEDGFRAGTTNVSPAEHFDTVGGGVHSHEKSDNLHDVESAVFGSGETAKLNTVEEAVFGSGDRHGSATRTIETLGRALRIENFYRQASQANPNSIRTMVI